MKVMIIGAGEVGYHTADRLAREGHEVTIIERDPGREKTLNEKINAMVIQGDGASAQVLEQANIASVDLFIAVTDSDEVNLIACILANEYGVPRKIARTAKLTNTADRKLDAKKLGIDLLINPQSVVAQEILNIVAYSRATEVAEFAEGKIIFLGYPIHAGSPLDGLSMRDLGGMRGIYRFVVTAINRHDKTIIPRGDDVIQPDDILYFMCRKEDLPAVQYLFGFETKETKKVFILGAGRVGAELATRLAEQKYDITAIEQDANQARVLAEKLDHSLVLHAEGTDVDTLVGEGIENADMYVAVTNDDQANILCALMAKKYGAPRAVALINEHELLKLAPSLGVDACISPRLATAAAILKYVRRGNILTMAMVEQSNAEVLEIVIPDNAPILNKPLHQIGLPRQVNIGAIVRGAEVIIPQGDDVLKAEDHIIVFALPEALATVESFFTSS